MQRLTEEQMKKMNLGARGVCPPPPSAGGIWLRVLDRVVRVLTLGRGRVLPGPSSRAPVTWCER